MDSTAAPHRTFHGQEWAFDLYDGQPVQAHIRIGEYFAHWCWIDDDVVSGLVTYDHDHRNPLMLKRTSTPEAIMDEIEQDLAGRIS